MCYFITRAERLLAPALSTALSESEMMRAQLLSRVPLPVPRVSHLFHSRASILLESRVAGHLVRAVPVRSSDPKAPSLPVQSVVDNEELQAALAAMHISEMTEVQVRPTLLEHLCPCSAAHEACHLDVSLKQPSQHPSHNTNGFMRYGPPHTGL